MADKKNQFTHYDAINWNKVIDPIDKATWEKLIFLICHYSPLLFYNPSN